MLGPGSRIAVVAPGAAVTPEQLAGGIACLRDWGWQAVSGPHLHERHRYLAGTRDERASDLIWALTAADIDAVWFARGGYGTAHLLATIPWQDVRARPVIGFSDATALACAMAGRGFPFVHGPVLSTLRSGVGAVDAESEAALLRLLAGDEATPQAGRLLAGPSHVVRGRLLGGNLTVLASLAGTPAALRAEGGIVFLEDVGEKPYRIERSLCQLLDSGAFTGVRGVALGEFLGTGGDEGELHAMWREQLGPLRVPVLEGIAIGHGRRNLAVPCGREVELHPDGLRWP